MLVEEYINELKKNNERKKIKKIVKEYNKEINFKLNSPAMTKPSNIYGTSILSLIGSLAPLYLKKENISLAIRSVYIVPSLVVSIITIILFTKVRKSKELDIKKVLTLGNFVILEFLGICFSGTYMMQFVLFRNWNSIDYLKAIAEFIVLLIPVIVVGIRSAPKKFIKQFSKENDYKNPSEVVVWISITLVIIANMTKPYRLMLAVFYGCIIYFTPIFIFVAYKAKKYDYIQSLPR